MVKQLAAIVRGRGIIPHHRLFIFISLFLRFPSLATMTGPSGVPTSVGLGSELSRIRAGLVIFGEEV